MGRGEVERVWGFLGKGRRVEVPQSGSLDVEGSDVGWMFGELLLMAGASLLREALVLYISDCHDCL